MGKIDTTNWGEFNLYDERLFTIDSGNKFDRSKMTVRNPTINFVGRTAQNNGINAVVDELNDIKPYEAGYITVALGGSIGASFVQPKPFYTSQNVIVLKPNVNMTDCVKRFICTAIQKESDLHYQAFVKELNSHIKRDFVVLLPVDVNGDPDWQYMEDYMRNIEVRVSTSISKLESAQGVENSKIDVSSWGDFRIGDLFTVRASKSVNKTYLNFDINGEYDFIGRTSTNNGVQGKLNKLNFEPNDKETYSVSQIGDNVCQYRENKWYSSQNIFILTPLNDEMNKAHKFITTLMTNTLKTVYGEDAYSHYPTLKTLKQMILKLPIDSKGNPDWQYMEEYMKNIESKVKCKIDMLIQI